MTAVYICECEHPKSQHKRERGGCRALDCDCAKFEADMTASATAQGVEQTRSSLTEQLDGAEKQIAQLERENERREETVARNVQERDRALDACDALREQRDLARTELASAKERHGIERRLERDAQVKLRQRLLAAEAELASARIEVAQRRAERDKAYTANAKLIDEVAAAEAAAEEKVRAVLDASARPDGQVIAEHVRYLCETCGSRYGFNHEHDHGPLTPVTVITARIGAPTE